LRLVNQNFLFEVGEDYSHRLKVKAPACHLWGVPIGLPDEEKLFRISFGPIDSVQGITPRFPNCLFGLPLGLGDDPVVTLPRLIDRFLLFLAGLVR